MAEVAGATNTQQAANSAGVLTNPNSVLDKDAFLKLFLTQLKYQDPTAPMETEKMLSQTADLTVIESQQNVATAIEEMVSQFKSSNSFGLVNTVGKVADTGYNAINVNGQREYEFSLYYGHDYKGANITIMDPNGNEVRNFSLEAGKEGLAPFAWDGTDDNGNAVSPGSYVIKSDYVTEDNVNKTTVMGMYKIDSVRFENDGTASFKLGDQYYAMDAIKEIKEGI